MLAIFRLYIFIIYFICTDAYILLVNENQQAGEVIFNSSIPKLGSDREYKINLKRSGSFVNSLIYVERKTGEVILRQTLICDGIFYPNLFTVYIDSFSNRLRNVEYYSLPLRILIIGENCHFQEYSKRKRRDLEHDVETFDKSTKNRIIEAKNWISETYASFSIPLQDQNQEICMKKSQFINNLNAFLPKTVHQFCVVDYYDVSDARFAIEKRQSDLVASENTCLVQKFWNVVISFDVKCEGIKILDSGHRLKIVFHQEIFNDTEIATRVRRELRNQSPFFEQALYMASVLEECDPGVIVTTVKARDPENSPVTYHMTSLLDSRTQSMFSIDPKLGTVVTNTRLDRELLDVHYFRITATDDTFPPRSGTTTLQINVIDTNDHEPIFEMQEYDASIREGVGIGTTVITLKATDQDIGKNAEVEYSIQSVNGGGMSTEHEDNNAFRIDSRSGVITTRAQLDRETTEVYTILVQASDMATPQSARKSSSATVVVHILDDNDNYPQFSERTYTVNINEDLNWAQNPVIAHLAATDMDQGANAAIRYAIIGGNTQSQFSIDSLSGDVSLVKPLDYETIRSYRLVVRAQDGGSPSRSNTTQLLVNVKDVNDNTPRFYTSLFQESVLENVPVGYSIVRVQAYDTDEGPNSEIRYSIAPRDSTGTPTDEFPLMISPQSGWITTTKELDRETQSKYTFQVIASDQGNPPLSSSTSVVISVQDVNDNDPVFEPKLYEAVVSEDDQPGTPVATVQATDMDEDQRLHYEITGGNVRGRFAITSQNGRGLVTVAQPLDYKQEKRYILTVTATDSGGRHDTATIYVNVSDANNFAPVFENAPYSATVFEDTPPGTTILVVSATDNDVGINAHITYTLGDDIIPSQSTNSASMESSSSSAPFAINAHTGAIVTTRPLDRETTSGYLLTVTARDGGMPPLSDTTDVELTIADVNDNKPLFKLPRYMGSVSEDALIGTSVLQVSATDADVGLNGRVRYLLSEQDAEDGTFVIDVTSGVVRTNKGLDRESVAVYDLTVIAVDRGTPVLSSQVPVTIRIEDINDSPPAFATDKLTLYIPENSPIGSTVGKIYAEDPDEGINAIVQYSIIGGDDSNSFSLVTRPGVEFAELLTMTELDYESSHKKYFLTIRAASPPLRSDVHVEVIVTDVNDNAPILKDFNVIFNNFKDCFPSGSIGRIPAFDADVTDKLRYRILSGNNANLVTLNETSGQLILSPQLNTNVPKLATMEISVSDGINDVKSLMTLTVRLITDAMLLNSITVRLNYMTKEAFLSPLLGYFIDGIAAIIPCPRENIFVFSIQDDDSVDAKILNVSFSAKRPDTPREEFYTPQFLKERVYLNRGILARLATVQVLPFDDNLCVREPCLNFEECLTVLKFGNASDFIHSDTVLFRPIYPVSAFVCQCPIGFTGAKQPFLCDTEVNLCYSNPCKNNGKCFMKEGGFTCSCLPGFTGATCDIVLSQDPCKRDICKSGSICTPLAKGGFICEDCSPNGGYEHYTELCELRSRSFGKNAFLTFPSLRQRHRFHLSLKFATQNPNGILLYNGRYNDLHDFVALEIIDNELQFSFSLGSNITSTSVRRPGGVADGKWHTATVNYYNKTVVLSLDECDTSLSIAHGTKLGHRWQCANYTEETLEPRCALLTEPCQRFLDLTGPLQIGGLPTIPSHFQVRNTDYYGCISDLYIDHQFVDLNTYVADNGSISGCPQKRDFCSSNPCQNGGTCREAWGTFKCDCREGFGGKNCAEQITSPWKFSGDGMLSFNPLLRPIQLPWLNAISLRTLQLDTFIMSVQLGQNSSAVLALKDGFVHYSYNNFVINLTSNSLSDGNWHHISVTWLGTEIKIELDFGEYIKIIPFPVKIQGLYVGKILLGGPDATYTSLSGDFNYFEGCLQDVRIGSAQNPMTRPTVRENVIDGCDEQTDCTINCPQNANCFTNFGESRCECTRGFVGENCEKVCNLNPCQNGQCQLNLEDERGYSCHCNSSDFSGDYCEVALSKPCPAGWWGETVCGPCRCDTNIGYNVDCDKITGECRCKENHWKPKRPDGTSKEDDPCIPCDCYITGSFSPQCDLNTGQCRCRAGVIGQRCDSCPNSYAEVTLRGCEVIYDGCPRSYANKLWWPRTKFGETAIENCPKHSHGKASRTCDNNLGGWQEPDMFNCTSDLFMELRKLLSQLEKGELTLNTYVAIKISTDLHKATNLTKELFGADVLITQQLIMLLLKYEGGEFGLNLTHSQDKDYISNLVHSASQILEEKYLEKWSRIEQLTGSGAEELILALYGYISVLSTSQRDTYTNPFEIVAKNIALGLDVVTAVSLFGYEPDNIPIHSPNDQSFTTERVILPDTSEFLKPGVETSPMIKPSPVIAFPKYNNYLKDDNKFDKISKFLVPLSLLGIRMPEVGELATKYSLTDSGAIVSYAQFKNAGTFLPQKYDESVLRRWGIDVCIGSPVISISILVPEYIEAVTKPSVNFEKTKKFTKKTENLDMKHENSAYLRDETIVRKKRHVYTGNSNQNSQTNKFENVFTNMKKDSNVKIVKEHIEIQNEQFAVQRQRKILQTDFDEHEELMLEEFQDENLIPEAEEILKSSQNKKNLRASEKSFGSILDDFKPRFFDKSLDEIVENIQNEDILNHHKFHHDSKDVSTEVKNVFKNFESLFKKNGSAEHKIRNKRTVEYDITKKLMYKSLTGVPLNQPIRIQIALDQDRLIFNERSNPQCVHWSTLRGKGEWSRVGCRTELTENWMDQVPLIINCTCNHLSSFAVLVDIIDLEYIPEPSLLEDVSSYSCFSISLPLLLTTWLILLLIRGSQTNSNTIHKNLVLCVFLAQFLYFIALKARKVLVENMFPCKLVAIALHYLWLCVFSWNLVDVIHLYRMLTEMRDINHGQMPFYFTVGYVLPGVIVSLPVGARVDQYGNYYFCWLSLYESVIWSLVGPVCVMTFINLAVLCLSIRAAFTLKDHVMGFGNLRTLLWLSVISLPLLVLIWVLALLMASDYSPMLTYLLSLAVLLHAVFSILGYCFINNRVRENLFRSILYCMGKKVPLLETTSVIGANSTSSHNINMPSSRSALAYHNAGVSGFEATSRRHIGISTSSTTSRSTTKTGSSPYRSDTHLRHNTTSTSTSNYNSTSDVPSYLHRHREVLDEVGLSHDHRRTADTESDSDVSEGRSLDLASSHSSDDEESSSTRRHGHRTRNTGVSTVGYLPNITEHVVSRCGTPPPLNVLTNSQLFPNVMGPCDYGRWTSRVPDEYLPNKTGEGGRWSGETASDNEFHKTSSPNPLPNPDVTPDTFIPHESEVHSHQYMLNTHHYLNTDQHYVHKLMKNDYAMKLADPGYEYGDHCSETEEKCHHGAADKYLFPYTAEEDHCGSPASYNHAVHQPPSRVMSPLPTNDINNPPEYRTLAMTAPSPRVGSVCGGNSIRGSPSPLMPPLVTMQHTQTAPDSEKDSNAETSV